MAKVYKPQMPMAQVLMLCKAMSGTESMKGDWWINISFRKSIGEDKIRLASSSQQTKNCFSDSVSLSWRTP